MKNKQVEMYWDVGSTNTYFAFHLLKPVLKRTGAKLVCHPYNLGYVFRANNYVLMDEPAIKIENRKQDLARWAAKYKLPFKFPRKFPIKTSRALRGSFAMRHFDLETPYIEAILSAYWEQDDASVQDYSGLRQIVTGLGVDPDEFETLSESTEIREQLADSTNEGMKRGVFGVPSMFVGNQLFWGKDRMDFVEDELLRS